MRSAPCDKNDTVAARDISTAHQVTALFEVTLVDSPARLNEPQRYEQPGSTESPRFETFVTRDNIDDGNNFHFAALIAGYAQVLHDQLYLVYWCWDKAIGLAQTSRSADQFCLR